MGNIQISSRIIKRSGTKPTWCSLFNVSDSRRTCSCFFRNSPVWAKLVVFLFLLTGTVEFGYVTLHPEFKSQGMDATHESQGMDPTKKLPVQAGIETIRVAHESQRKNPTHKSPVQARTEAIRVAHESQGMKGSDDVGNIPTKLNSECPESTIYDWSKSPPESRIERRCS